MDVLFTDTPGRHSAYEEMLAHPPEGVRYHIRPLTWGAPLTGSGARDRLTWATRGAMRLLAGLPDATPLPDPGMPIHSAQGLLRTSAPWVVDFEHPNVFTGFDGDRLREPSAKHRLTRLLAPARAVLPWTEAAADAVRAVVPDVAPRVRVVRPAIAPRPRAVEDPEHPLVLFVGRHFRRKGGLEALEAFARARAEAAPRATMLMVSNAPEEIQAKYAPHGVKFLPPTQSRARILQEFARASVYMMPTHFDTFGMVFLEAFAHGVPVLTTDTFGVDEIVSHGEDGLVVPGYSAKWHQEDGTPAPGRWDWVQLRREHDAGQRERIVAQLAQGLSMLLREPDLRRKMGDQGRGKVIHGAFSTAERNRRLLEVYRAAFD